MLIAYTKQAHTPQVSTFRDDILSQSLIHAPYSRGLAQARAVVPVQ